MFKLIIAAVLSLFWIAPVNAQVAPPMDLTGQFAVLKFKAANTGVGKGHVLLIGTSIDAFFYYSQACGDLVLNFGIPGARTHDILPYAPWLMAFTEPADVIIDMGTNDVAQNNYWQFSQDEFNLTLAIKQAGVNPVLMTMLPTETTTIPAFDAWNNPSATSQYNQYIKATASVLGLIVQDANVALSDGFYLPSGSTYDGLHPKGALAVELWHQVESAVAASRAARGLSCPSTPASLIPQ